MNDEIMKYMKEASHPCFNKEARHQYARVHLPVAPKCNIQCNYCNRQYDCVNESRPGVTSAVLSPHQAVAYLTKLHKHIDNISVIGIAGPGDPFANPEKTLETLELVKAKFPEKIFCLSTNGLNLIPYINRLKELDVTHVTITINATETSIAKNIYSWVRKDKKVYRGEQAAKVLLDEQFKAIPLLKEAGITVKINSIILPGINQDHLKTLAEKVKSLGADIMNCIPVYPVADTVFAEMQKPDLKLITRVKKEVSEHIDLMTHCARCRADAAGLLGADFGDSFRLIQEYASGPLKPEESRPYIAVATHEGILVNQHLGEASSLYIFRQTPNGFQLVEERPTPEPGSGDFRWIELSEIIKDCKAVLTSGAGEKPVRILHESGLRVIQMNGLIDEGLEAVFNNRPLKTVTRQQMNRCRNSCNGSARGCA